VPTVGEIETLLAPEVVQLSVLCAPIAMVLGLAAKRTIWAAVAVTVTVATAVTVLPSEPVALIV
jgi:uncharacterized membrane protein YccC